MRRTEITAMVVVAALAVCGRTGAAYAEDAEYVETNAERNTPALGVDRSTAVFGEKGQLAISTDAALSIERRTQSGTTATTTVSILPAVDFFVYKNISVGGVVGVIYQKTGDYRATSFRLGPRVGYNIGISRLLSLWPKLGFSYSYNKQKNTDSAPDGAQSSVVRDNNAIALNVFAPLMLHPAPHFFAGFGPFIDVDLNGQNRATTWGFRLTLGGWL